MKLLLLLLMYKILLDDGEAYRVIKPNNDSIFISKRDASSTPSHSRISQNCSLVNLLANITSNVTIYISTDMMLSSVIQLTHLRNIAITGYNNPTVQCGCNGGLYFVRILSQCYN